MSSLLLNSFKLSFNLRCNRLNDNNYLTSMNGLVTNMRQTDRQTDKKTS